YILLVEIDGEEAETIAKELKAAGVEHVSRSVENVAGFLAGVKEFKPELILAAYPSRHSGGAGLLDQAREICPDVPLLVIADSAHNGVAVDAIQKGAVDCIYKDQFSQLAPAAVRAIREAEQRVRRRRAEVLLEVKIQQLSLQNDALRESETRFRQLAESIH